jgi:hypothetical protein
VAGRTSGDGLGAAILALLWQLEDSAGGIEALSRWAGLQSLTWVYFLQCADARTAILDHALGTCLYDLGLACAIGRYRSRFVS